MNVKNKKLVVNFYFLYNILCNQKNFIPNFRCFLKTTLIFFFTKEKKIFIVFSNKITSKSIEIPNFILVKKKEKNLFFKDIVRNSTTLLQFLNLKKKIVYLLQNLDKKFKKYLIVKGLGMRIKYNQSFHKLQLKLGYSNIITIDVPASIQIFKNKDVLTIEGNNATTVGNFANSVRNLKYPDSYKGKGIWYKNEFRTLKPVKKV